MITNKKSLLFLTISFAITGVFLFSVPQVWARDPIDINIGLNLNALIADHINELAGRRVVTFIPYSITNAVSTTGTNNQGDPTKSFNGQVAGTSIANVAGTATGTTGSLALSMALSLLIALSYLTYTQTGLFLKREMSAIIKKQRLDKKRFNFAS